MSLKLILCLFHSKPLHGFLAISRSINQNRKKMEQLKSFCIICLYILGALGGVGYALYNSAYPIAIGVVALAIMAYPTLYNAVQNIFK